MDIEHSASNIVATPTTHITTITLLENRILELETQVKLLNESKAETADIVAKLFNQFSQRENSFESLATQCNLMSKIIVDICEKYNSHSHTYTYSQFNGLQCPRTTSEPFQKVL